MAKSESNPTLTGGILTIVFFVFLVIFVDSAWVLGQHLWLKAFGAQAEGRVIGADSFRKKDRKGKAYKVSVYRYAFEDAQGYTHEGVTGQKSFLFGDRRSVSAWEPGTYASAPRVTVLYLPGNPRLSWVPAYERELGGSIFLTVLLLFFLTLTGGGALAILRKDLLATASSNPGKAGGAVPPPHAPQGASASRSSPGKKKKKGGKRRRK
ncbi:DUF3592 domain-containing protein [Hyalangium gracile]|uniref:DUF3592 domain-containing protein n=1 Tax=Hyalangium gracile TaxID=394092 RepID=UPI001CCEA8BC|nr:DUF3592 domain-containing protein [Hyalangium gracile]